MGMTSWECEGMETISTHASTSVLSLGMGDLRERTRGRPNFGFVVVSALNPTLNAVFMLFWLRRTASGFGTQ